MCGYFRFLCNLSAGWNWKSCSFPLNKWTFSENHYEVCLSLIGNIQVTLCWKTKLFYLLQFLGPFFCKAKLVPDKLVEITKWLKQQEVPWLITWARLPPYINADSMDDQGIKPLGLSRPHYMITQVFFLNGYQLKYIGMTLHLAGNMFLA